MRKVFYYKMIITRHNKGLKTKERREEDNAVVIMLVD